jgi:hypothetical protein
MPGVEAHIGNSDHNIRKQGMVLAETLASVVDLKILWHSRIQDLFNKELMAKLTEVKKKLESSSVWAIWVRLYFTQL